MRLKSSRCEGGGADLFGVDLRWYRRITDYI